MRVLIIDADRVGLDFALRCAAHGHEVRWFRFAKKPTKDGEGFKGIKIIDDWKASMAWAKEGLILATCNNKYLADLDRFRDHGFKIFAPTLKSAALEVDRGAGMKVMESVGVPVAPYQVFAGLEEAEAFARKSDKPFVFKPMGDEEDKSLTYCASDPADLVGWLRRKISAGAKLKGQCMLQEKIDMLCDYGVSGWMGPEGFLPDRWQICFEHKKLMSGECGPNTGEQGSVTQYVESDKLAEDALKPLEPILRALGHCGDFSIGVGIDTKGKAWAFEFTARCGWPAFWIQTASHKGDPAQWMRDLLDGKDSLKVSYDAAIGVVMSQPPYPYDDNPGPCVEGNPICGLEDVWDDVHPVSVMLGRGPKFENGKVVEGPIYQTTGAYVLTVTALGKTITQARKRVYDTVNSIKFKDALYRDDIGEKIEPVLPTLHKHGYATNLQYD